jgi:hypothetical protein
MPYSMWTLFTAAIGNFENETYLDPEAPPTSVFFFVVYTFVISIILFNLLITLLTDAYSQVCAPPPPILSVCSPVVGPYTSNQCTSDTFEVQVYHPINTGRWNDVLPIYVTLVLV